MHATASSGPPIAIRSCAAPLPLSVREAEEYAYVARDVRRIATIAAGLFAIMIGLWIALQVSGVGAI